ncbi:MAG: EamA family transporter [Planctomycetes bacterium]|nr:EamA family transporter [Planctomycetota bacterium]
MTPAPDNPRNRRIATFALLSTCVFWGATFTWMKQGMEALAADFPGTHETALGAYFLLVRFALACLLLPVFIPASLRTLNAASWKWGFWVSLPFAIGFLLQIIGLSQADVPPSQSAFLTSLFVVATPILSSLVYRRIPPLGVLVGVVLATTGAAFIQGPPQGGLSLGAWLTIAAALVFGGHILVTDVATKRAPPMAVTMTMFLFSTLWMLLALLVSPGGPALLAPAALQTAALDTSFLLMVSLCAVFATVIAMSVLNRWQKELLPSRAAIIYTAEPVFATLISLFFSNRETLTVWLFFGAGMILAANLAAELIRPRKPATTLP